MDGRVYCPADAASQKSARVLSSRVLGDRDHSLHCMAGLAVFGKDAMVLAAFRILAVMSLMWLTIEGYRVLPNILMRSKNGNINLE